MKQYDKFLRPSHAVSKLGMRIVKFLDVFDGSNFGGSSFDYRIISFAASGLNSWSAMLVANLPWLCDAGEDSLLGGIGTSID